MHGARSPGASTPRYDRVEPDRLVVVMSDIEMGTGGPTDDFPHSRYLGERILSYAEGTHDGLAIDIVFNGDAFDLLKTSYQGGYPHRITAEIATDKMRRVGAAHGPFFEALRRFLERPGAPRRVHFLAGNHDLELLFPEVQALVCDLCGGHEAVGFPGFSLEIGRVHIEHGSQLDPLFRVDETRPFLPDGGTRLLNLSWGSVALLDVAIPLSPLLHHLDRLKPKALVLKLLPEVKQLLTGAFWRYWTWDYWRDLVGRTDPLKTVSLGMLRELLWRLVTWDPEVSVGDDLQRRIVESDRFDVYVVGHVHEPAWWSYGRRKVLRTGAMRDEFMLSPDGAVQAPINKTFAEVFLAGDEVVRSYLVEEPGPPRPPGTTLPESIFDILPEVRERLAALAERANPSGRPPRSRARRRSR